MSGDDTTTTETTTTDDQTDLQATEVDQQDNGTDDTGDEGKGETRSQRRHQRDRDRADAAEARAAELAGRVEAYQRREVLRMAENTLAEPEDLLAVGGHEVSDFLDPETGELDEGAVAAALDRLTTTRPGLLKGATPPRRGGYVDWGHTRAGVLGMGDTGATWDDALEVRQL